MYLQAPCTARKYSGIINLFLNQYLAAAATTVAAFYLGYIMRGKVKGRIYFCLMSFWKNAINGGAAAAHRCIDGTRMVKLLLDVGEGRMLLKYGLFEIVGDFILPLTNG